MSLTPYVTIAPTSEPVTVAEMKLHLRLDATTAEPDPYAAPGVALGSGAGNVDNGVHRYKVSFTTADGETLASPASDAVTVTDKTTIGKVSLTAIPVGGSAVTGRKLYRSTAGTSSYYLLTTLSDNTTTTYTDNTADSGLGAGEPTANTTNDAEASRLITLGRQLVERHTDLALLTQTVAFKGPGFVTNSRGEMVLYLRPLQSVSSITYVDINGDTQTWSSAEYEVALGGDKVFPVIKPRNGYTWPTPGFGLEVVTVTGVFGYSGTTTVPAQLKQAMKLAAGQFFNNREVDVIGTIVQSLPMGYAALIAPFRGLRF